MTDAPLLLLVDDNPADLALTATTLGDIDSQVTIVTAADGIEALDYLRRGEARRPDLILLDLNMPRKDGREVLRDIKQDESLCAIPVIVHSTSTAPDDVSEAYRLHANSYVGKAAELGEFRETLSAIMHYWLETVRLPGVH